MRSNNDLVLLDASHSCGFIDHGGGIAGTDEGRDMDSVIKPQTTALREDLELVLHRQILEGRDDGGGRTEGLVDFALSSGRDGGKMKLSEEQLGGGFGEEI